MLRKMWSKFDENEFSSIKFGICDPFHTNQAAWSVLEIREELTPPGVLQGAIEHRNYPLTSNAHEKVTLLHKLDGESVHDAAYCTRGNFVAAVRDHPLCMYSTAAESSTDHHVATYVPVTSGDEMSRTISVAAAPDGQTLVGGCRDSTVHIFDTSVPGKSGQRLSTRSQNRMDPYSQKGCVSTLAYSPTTVPSAFIAVGVLSSVGLYDIRCSGNDAGCCSMLFANASASLQNVNCVRFDETGMRMWVSGESCDTIKCFDLRRGVELTQVQLSVPCAKRTRFDIHGDRLAIVNSAGDLQVFKTATSTNARDSIALHVTGGSADHGHDGGEPRSGGRVTNGCAFFHPQMSDIVMYSAGCGIHSYDGCDDDSDGDNNALRWHSLIGCMEII